MEYDSFRVSAVFEDGSTIDNDIVKGFGNEAVEAELEEAREWFKDRDVSRYMVSYYKDGTCIENEYR